MPLDQQLILSLVLVGHHSLARHLSITVQFLRDGRVVLRAALADAGEALGSVDFHCEGVMIFHTRISHNLLSLLKGLDTGHVVYEFGRYLPDGIDHDRFLSLVIYKVRLARVIVDPEALCRLHLHHVAILHAIVLAIPRSTHINQRLMIY